MGKTKIEWTKNDDGSLGATWNPVRGCTKISLGCKNCYAETFAERWRGVPGHPYEQGFDLRLVPEKLDEPLRWKKPRRIFVNSMSDLFQDGVPFEYIDKVFAVMALCHEKGLRLNRYGHTFQLLTKRADRMLEYVKSRIETWPGSDDYLKPLPNVWLGVSAENQEWADKRIPLLLQTPAAIRFVSYEPALAAVDFSEFIRCKGCGYSRSDMSLHLDHRLCKAPTNLLDQIIVGGESGPGARPFHVRWAGDVVRQCKATGTACFVKQLGAVPMEHPSQIREWPAESQRRFKCFDAVGPLVKMTLQDRKGGTMEEWPSDLRVREFPK